MTQTCMDLTTAMFAVVTDKQRLRSRTDLNIGEMCGDNLLADVIRGYPARALSIVRKK